MEDQLKEVKKVQVLMKMNQELNEFSRHIVLYSKGHYKRSKLNEKGEGLSFYDDLRKIVAYISGTEVCYVLNHAVDAHVIRTLVEMCSRTEVTNAMCKFLGASDPTRMIQIVLEHLAGIVVVEDNVKIWDLGEPNPEILPLAKNHLED